ncbi:MAG TPA: methyltransferase domain-containing protein [Woeseiaceae bacterium]|nr:methyltransferase domain-containing protein [Woeseiaceae bacterium]
MKPSHPVNGTHLERRADRAAPGFEAGVVHAHTQRGLLERLDPIAIEPAVVLDLGCGTGAATVALEKRFRGARIVGTERSAAMAAAARARRPWLSRAGYVRCRPAALPFADGAVDVVYSNLLLAHGDPQPVLAEVARVLKPGGLFAFAALGPDSLGVLRRAWAAVDDDLHVQRFPDMHDLGDLLVRSGLADPVLDVDRLSLEYRSAAGLFADLTAAAARNVLRGRRTTLTGRDRFRRMTSALAAAGSGEAIRVELEIVYGHGWGSGRGTPGGAVHIPAESIPLRRR